MKSQKQTFLIILTILVNILLSLFLLAEAYYSLRWRMVHDGPILFYMGFLIENFNAVPFRDFFDMNMPGAHLLNALVGAIFGFTDSGFQKANILFLFATLVLIFLWLRSFGLISAWTATNLFGVVFLQYGPAMSMQREFLSLPFLLLALICYSSKSFFPKRVMYLFCGLAVGCAVLIKPQTGLLLAVFPVIDGWQLFHDRKGIYFKKWAIDFIWLIAGFTLPVIGTLLYLKSNNALMDFWEIATGYWPLYTEINARLEISSGWEKFPTSIASIPSIGIHSLWLLPAACSSIFILSTGVSNRTNRKKIFLMIGGVCVSLIEVIIANKYWEYHWLPMILFMIMLACTGLASSRFNRLLPNVLGIFLVGILVLHPAEYFILQISGNPLPSPQGGRVDEITEYLKKNLDPGDTVQPLDWSNGAVQAMLMSRAQPATRYLYDFHFFHHISTPEIKHLRADFLHQLQLAHPKVVIEFYEGRPWVNGTDTTRSFAELNQYLDEKYYVDVDRGGYRIWMRNQ